MSMTIKFWGVRGSIPSPGPETAHVGGNTSCVEVQCGNDRIVFDAGSGLRRLGDELMQSGQPVELTLLMSHVHWDHIQGLPFFVPAYVPGTRMTIAGRPGDGMSMKDVLVRQMSPPVFPVTLDAFRCHLTVLDLGPDGDTLQVGKTQVRWSLSNHPGGVLVYRVEHAGRSLVYATDVEHSPEVVDELSRVAHRADVLIYDAMYTPEEYRGDHGRSRVGWGHSTWEAACEIARRAWVKQLVLFHHDPQRHDAAVQMIEVTAQQVFAATVAAREGMQLHLSPLALAA